ncbi:carbohydrate ABC transporter permease [Candidatus Entotheonella palauensis]|uniref:carbohydrate ABC transporter permease n=1 Tax=Candidatus Entotheonella palauensis TaxID=93172 RepID=UPI0015C42367|nr:carbohydrate ABC transporter permease [Candidatus Entotheonella palauensis]
MAAIPIWLFGMILAVAWIAPFVWMIGTSVKPSNQVMIEGIQWIPREFTLDNYRFVIENHPILRWVLNSIIVAGTTTLTGILFGAMAGYGMARLNFPGRDALFFLTLATIMVPEQIALVPLFVGFLKLGWINNYPALIAPGIANVLTLYIFRQFFLNLPVELEDAALIDGASRFTIFTRIALPLARSAAVASAILIFAANWNAFLWPLLIAFEESMKTLTVGAAYFAPVVGGHTQIQGFAPAMAAVTILSMPIVILYLFLQRYFVEGITRGAVKG